ncbi:NACHT domain-containing protein [Streptomyces mayteni]
MRRGLTFTCVLLVLLGLVLVGWGLATGADLSAVNNALGVLSALLGTLGVLATWLRPVPAEADVLDGKADSLAQLVLAQQRKRRSQLLGRDFRAIDIAFRHVPEPGRNADHAAARGTFTHIAAYFARLRPRRLVITGEPGAGKTLLATELMIQLLEARQHGGHEPLPFLVSLPAWDTSSPFVDWLAGELAAAYQQSPSLAAALVEQERIVPVLDGLDEMDAPGQPPQRAQQALDQLNAYHGPLVLTCRADEYATLRSSRRWLWDSAPIEITELTASQAHGYLLSRAPDPGQWQDILDDMRRAGNGALATTLTTPWLLTLAATVSLADGAPRLLADFVGVPAPTATDPGTLEQRLLARALPSLTALHARPGRGTYVSDDVVRWCSRLAVFLRDTGGRRIAGRVMPSTDVVPHEMWPIAGNLGPRLLAAGLTVALWSPFLLLFTLLMVANGYLPSPGMWAVTLVSTLPVAGAWGAFRPWLQPRQIIVGRLFTGKGLARFALSALVGLVLGWNASLVFSTAFGVPFGSGFAAVFGLGIGMAVRWDIHLNATFATAVLTAAVFGALAGALGNDYGRYAGLVAGLAAGAVSLFVAVSVGISVARRHGGGAPDEPEEAPTPRTALRDDLVAGLIAGLIAGAVAFVVTWRAPWLDAPLPLAAGLGVSAALAAGPGFVAETSRRYLAMLLLTRGQLPWRLSRFLDWAYDAGILRMAASTYQFRHNRLQQWLAR